MTDERSRVQVAQPGAGEVAVSAAGSYEPPALIPLGNVRDLLAGGGGIYNDTDTGFPDLPGGA
jgi:hypothetical protein